MRVLTRAIIIVQSAWQSRGVDRSKWVQWRRHRDEKLAFLLSAPQFTDEFRTGSKSVLSVIDMWLASSSSSFPIYKHQFSSKLNPIVPSSKSSNNCYPFAKPEASKRIGVLFLSVEFHIHRQPKSLRTPQTCPLHPAVQNRAYSRDITNPFSASFPSRIRSFSRLSVPLLFLFHIVKRSSSSRSPHTPCTLLLRKPSCAVSTPQPQ